MFELGLYEVADGVWAYLQPDGSWGYSNAGLVAGDGTSLLVDTLFDLKLTRRCSTRWTASPRRRPIDTVVNTHANGDHCYGNQLVRDARIIASDARGSRRWTRSRPPLLHAFKQLDIGEDGNGSCRTRSARSRSTTSSPSRRRTRSPAPRRSTSAAARCARGGRPAHTRATSSPGSPTRRRRVHRRPAVPRLDADHVGRPGRRTGSRRAGGSASCEPSVVVPGHGALADVDGVVRLERYLEWIDGEVTKRQTAGMSAIDAAWDLELGRVRRLG